MRENKKPTDFSLGEHRGQYELKWVSDSGQFQVWENSNGRFMVLDALSDVSVKYNIREEEDAIYVARERAGELSDEEAEEIVLHGTTGKGVKKKQVEYVEREIGETVPKYTAQFVGGSRDYGVWRLGSGQNYQIATKRPEKAITAAVSERRMQEMLGRYSPEIGYQQQLPLESADWGKKVTPEGWGAEY
jgi:hypothetical protein